MTLLSAGGIIMRNLKTPHKQKQQDAVPVRRKRCEPICDNWYRLRDVIPDALDDIVDLIDANREKGKRHDR